MHLLTPAIPDVDEGNKVGVPIKASDFYNKPMLKFLEGKFANESARTQHKARVKNAVDLFFLRQPNQSMQSLMKLLEKDGIKAVLRQNKEGIIYGVTYVDHQTKCVLMAAIWANNTVQNPSRKNADRRQRRREKSKTLLHNRD